MERFGDFVEAAGVQAFTSTLLPTDHGDGWGNDCNRIKPNLADTYPADGAKLVFY